MSASRVYLVDLSAAARARELQALRADKEAKRRQKIAIAKAKARSKEAEAQEKKAKRKKPKAKPSYRRQIVPYVPGMGKQFYDSDRWIALRYQAIRFHGKKCQCCGTTEAEFHVDHIKPRSKFPHLELDFDNLQILCRDCNIGKSNTDSIDWRNTGPLIQAAKA